MTNGTIFGIVIVLAILAVFVLARRGRKAREDEQAQREDMREANAILRDINKSLGFADGQGPTEVVIDGQRRIVNIGHSARMKDPNYQKTDEIAALLLDAQNPEGALEEANAAGDRNLAAKVQREMNAIEERVMALANQLKR